MKITRSLKNSRRQGGVLIVALSMVTVAIIALAGYFMIVQDENTSVARSQSWNCIVSVAESGLEEGMALIDQGYPAPITAPMSWTNNTSGWSQTNGVYTLSRTVSGSNTYTVQVDATGLTPTITSVGTVPFTPIPWAFSSAGGPFFAQLGNTTASTSATLGRKVQIQTVLSPLFTAAVITKSNFDLKGNNALVDSFDSTVAAYNTAGQYDSTKAKANGSVGTDSSIANSLNLGNGNIYGKVMTGPGTAQSAVNVGNNGAVGDAAWNIAHTGIESNYWSGDFNVNIPDVPAPSAGTTLPAASNGFITLSSGSYLGTPTAPIKIMGPVTLWVPTSYSPNITIASSNNASLTLYVGNTSGSAVSLSLSGQSSINSPGYAKNLQIYGLPTLTSISMTGNSQFIGTIYAPEADLKGGGGGNNKLDTSGAMIVKSVTLNGHWNFHYDESLSIYGPSRGWIPKNWTELKYP